LFIGRDRGRPFHGALADLLATVAMAEWASADTIRIGIALDS
jgi:hypothetical protein